MAAPITLPKEEIVVGGDPAAVDDAGAAAARAKAAANAAPPAAQGGGGDDEDADAAFLTWLLADFRGVVDVHALTAHVRVYLREVHDDDALNAVARRPDDTYPREKPARRPEFRVSHDDASLDGSIGIEISPR